MAATGPLDLAARESHQRRLRKPSRGVDYNQLDNFSSVVLYETKPQRRRTYRTKFVVERIISRRNVRNDEEYLVMWKDWPMESCSWEPSSHLSPELIRGYDKPPHPCDERMQVACRNFYTAIISYLKGTSLATFYASVDLDVWRYVSYNKGRSCEHQGHKLYEKNDFDLFNFLPNHWWYFLDIHGEGRAICFPMKVKPVLSWTPAHYISQKNKLVPAPRMPMEKLSITITKRACNMETLLSH